MTASDRIDRIVTNRIAALPIFVVVMAAVYWIAMGPLGTFLTDWTNDVLVSEWAVEGARGLLEGNVADWLVGLVCDGIIAGVGAVIGFVPQMLLLFLMLSILEDITWRASPSSWTAFSASSASPARASSPCSSAPAAASPPSWPAAP